MDSLDSLKLSTSTSVAEPVKVSGDADNPDKKKAKGRSGFSVSILQQALPSMEQSQGSPPESAPVADGPGLGERQIKTVFTPFPEIPDVRHTSYIDQVFKCNAALRGANYTVTEKIDGTSLTTIIRKEGSSFYSRYREITPALPHCGLPQALDQYNEDFEKIRNRLIERNYDTITLRGESFGSEICRRINYGNKNSYALYAFEINGQYQTCQKFREFIEEIQFARLKPVPELASGLSFEEAANYPVEFVKTQFSEVEEKVEGKAAEKKAEEDVEQVECAAGRKKDFIEGVVMQPEGFLIRKSETGELLSDTNNQHSSTDKFFPFMLKIKSQASREVKTKKARSDISEKESPKGVESLCGYITKNRMINVCLNHGIPTAPGELGKYIQLLIEDAKKDFFSANPELDKGKLSGKWMKKLNKDAALLFKNHYSDIFISDD